MEGMKRLSPTAAATAVIPLLAGALLACSVLAPGAAARDIHVNNATGDDRFTGRSLQRLEDYGGPVRTIGRALELAQPGDRIVLAKNDRPYHESITLAGNRHSEYPGSPLVIAGNGAILDGSQPVPEEAWEHYRGGVFRFRPPRAAHGNLFLDGRPATRVVPEYGAAVPPSLQPKEWCLLDGWIYFCVEPEKLPEDYPLGYAHLRTGITLYHVHGVAIADLTVQGFQLDGIAAANSARDVYLGGVTARGNGRAGVSVGGASSVVLEGCLLGNNGEAQLLSLPYSQTETVNSVLLGNTAPGWLDRGGRMVIDGQRAEGGRDEVDPERE